MILRRGVCGMFSLVALLLLTACAQPQAARLPYYGPTESIDQLVEDVNRYTLKVPTLWAKGDYDAKIVDHGHETDVSGDALLMYGKPKNMLFVGWAGPLGQVFRMGSGPQQYWLTVKGDVNTTWHGAFQNISRADLGALPVRPDLVEAVLGLDGFDTDLAQQPCPVMRFNNDEHAYMVVWHVRLPDRWLAQKEVWYDLDSKLPRLVHLFDENGRIVLSAYLSDYKPIKPADASSFDGPTTGPTTGPAEAVLVASHYHLYFPESKSVLDLHLSDIRYNSQGRPDARNFAFVAPTDTKLIDLDAFTR